MNMKKNGFTLLELVAVILVIGLLVLIVAPITSKLISGSKKTSYKNSVDNLLRAIKQDQVSDGKLTTKTYNISNGTINPSIIYDGSLTGSGYVMVFSDGKTSALVDEGNFCVYKLKDDKKTSLINENCGVGDVFSLSEGNITRHSVELMLNFNSVIGEFSIKKELETDSNAGSWIQNKNNRTKIFENLTPGEDYFFMER